jgi:hypothetical protein
MGVRLDALRGAMWQMAESAADRRRNLNWCPPACCRHGQRWLVPVRLQFLFSGGVHEFASAGFVGVVAACGAAGPYVAGSGPAVAAPGAWNLGPSSAVADLGGTAIGTLAYQRSEPTGIPVRLASRPVFLAGREGLLAELDARLTIRPGPRLVALCGLGGTGKTSVAVEYAHRHLAEVGVCWQFAAEDLAELEAGFAVLAAELGARDVMDARDPVASVHGVLARAGVAWLLDFDNVPDRASYPEPELAVR